MFKVNEYFEGKVKSIAFDSVDGPATAGVMAAGDYEFGTSCKEIMIVTSGAMSIMLPSESEFKEYKAYEKFEVEANKKFKVSVKADCSYICLYK